MKPKKTWLILAIVFILLGVLFLSSAVLSLVNLDTSKFTDTLSYTEGIVKDLNWDTANNENISSYSISLEENTILIIDMDAVENEIALNNVKRGDEITFAFSLGQEILDDEDPIIITPAFLSHDNETIISIKSYEESINKNIKISACIGLISAIVFCSMAILFYFQWVQKRKKYVITKD